MNRIEKLKIRKDVEGDEYFIGTLGDLAEKVNELIETVNMLLDNFDRR